MKEEILFLCRGQNLPVTNILNESQYSIDGIWCSIGLTPQKQVTQSLEKGFHRTTEYCGSKSYSKIYLG